MAPFILFVVMLSPAKHLAEPDARLSWARFFAELVLSAAEGLRMTIRVAKHADEAVRCGSAEPLRRSLSGVKAEGLRAGAGQGFPSCHAERREASG